MSTAYLEAPSAPRQLSFGWTEVTKSPAVVPIMERPFVRRTESKTDPIPPRLNKPTHISELMVAVLAKYGIDKNEIEAILAGSMAETSAVN